MKSPFRHAKGARVMLDDDTHPQHMRAAEIIEVEDRKNAGPRYRVRFARDHEKKYLDADRCFPGWRLIPLSAAEIKSGS